MSNPRREAARRVAEAHRGIDDASLLAYLCASASEESPPARLDVEMGIAFQTLPAEEALLAACSRCGGSAWRSRRGDPPSGAMSVSFRIGEIEVRLAYRDRATLSRKIDALLAESEADSDAPLRAAASCFLRAEALAGHAELARLQARLTRFPPALACAMVKHFLATPTPWRAISQNVDRDAGLWCRETQVDACYRLCGVSAALSRRYFTRFQVKRMRNVAATFEHAPEALAERIERMLEAPPRAAFAELFALEGEVLELVAREMPQIDLAPVRSRRAAFQPAPLAH